VLRSRHGEGALIEFRLLGPVEVVDGERRLDLGAPKQRALLAILLLHRGELVSADRLVDELWGEQPPSAAAKNVQVYVSRLRKALGDGVLVTRGSGYALEPAPEAVDLDRFERLVESGRDLLAASDARGAARTLRAALELWRGRPLADFAHESFAQTEIARLEELRLAALEDRVEADLALGRHAALVPELEALVREQPLRERLRGALMLALYRCGRQSEALDVYRAMRRALVEELGLEPSPPLQRLQRAILAHDPELEPPPTAVRAAAMRRAGWWLVAAGAVLAGAAAPATAVELTRGGAGVSRMLPNNVGAIDPKTNKFVAEIPAGNRPAQLTVGEGGLWVLNADDATVSRIDPVGRRLLETFSTSSTPFDLAAGAGGLWVANAGVESALPVSLTRFELAPRIRGGTTSLGQRRAASYGGRLPGEAYLAVGGGSVWAIGADSLVRQLDPRTQRVIRVVPLSARSLTYGGGALWALEADVNGVVRVEPRTGRVTQRILIPSVNSLQALVVGEGAVWVTAPFQGLVYRIDPGPPPNQQTVSVTFGVSTIAFGADAVWVGNDVNDTLSRIDPKTNEVTAELKVPSPQALAFVERTVWVSSGVPSGRSGALTTASCGKLIYGGNGEPDLLIASDLALQGSAAAYTLPMTKAIELVLRKHGFHAGRHTVGYQSCDDATQQAGGFDVGRCFANAKAYAVDATVIGLVGTYNTGCAMAEIPVLNRAPRGPLAMVSPMNTFGPPTRRQIGMPADFMSQLYPTGVRNYARVIGADHIQVAADAALAKQLGLRRVGVVYDRLGSTSQTERAWFAYAAAKLGSPAVLSLLWRPDRPNFASVVARLHRGGADGLFITGATDPAVAAGLIRTVRRAFGPRFPIIVTDWVSPWPQFAGKVGPAASGVYASLAGLTTPAALPPAGRALQRELGRAGRIAYAGAYGAQAAEVLLDAIARSDGTRASVARQLLRTHIRGGYAGDLRFDQAGDPVTAPVTIFLLRTGATNATGSADFQDAVIDRVITPPTIAIPPP
jgi:DNA-binding SARP family transcriptional activator/DNA-binding beta-propeller fold protein YncE/ABC-type branched-subunit amino acid transport system substrate-binding protein